MGTLWSDGYLDGGLLHPLLLHVGEAAIHRHWERSAMVEVIMVQSAVLFGVMLTRKQIMEDFE